jgi:integrase/recombinase XerD
VQVTPLAPHLTAFLREHLEAARQSSQHTCDSYAYAFQLFLAFAGPRLRTRPAALAVEQFDAPLVLAFLDHLESVRHNGASSRNARLAAIRSFARFLEYRVPAHLDDLRRILAIPMKRTTSRLVAHLSRDEMQAILDAPIPTTRMGIRDRAMFHVAFAGGLRVSELVGLQLDDLTLQPFASIRIRGKGRRERVLPLWQETTKALRSWLAVRGEVPTVEIFVNAHGGALTRSGVEHLLAKHVAVAARAHPSLNGKRVSPHVLRHTCAMLALQATGDVRKVALWLGHASVQTTEVYLRADPSEKLEALAAMTPMHLRPGRFRPLDKLIASLKTTKEQRGIMQRAESKKDEVR